MFYAYNPLWNCYDRADQREAFAGVQTGIDPRTGKTAQFEYGPVIDHDPDSDKYINN